VDVVLYAQHLGQAQARRLGLNDVRVAGAPLTTQEMFVYLHKKHAPLVPRLAEALRQIKADGTYARLERATLRDGAH
jgi:polar amino acid transport system substrate-binding protein